MFIFIDKPKGLTSHDVVNRIRKITGEKRVGHAGTLDPNATGLLIVGIGRESTKKLNRFMKLDKEYEAEIVIGETRDTDDTEGKIIEKTEISDISESTLLKAIKSFVGKQTQLPPQYSAIKVKGIPAYKDARKGKKVDLKERMVNIYSIKVLNYNYPKLVIRCKVSSGTYIRSLARDLGERLGVGGYLGNLQRISVGKYSLKDAVKLDKLNIHNWKKFNINNET